MSTRLLAHGHICRLGAPVLRAVDTRIFTERYFTHCMDCGFCGDACCDHGVDVDVGNVARLKAAPASFHARVGVPPENWFTQRPIADSEFPGGAHLRTAVRDGACIFRDRAGRGCMIHGWCLENGVDYHTLKPMISVFFPLTFEQGVLMPSTEILDGSLICRGEGPSCYDGVRGELAWYFGAALVTELDSLSRLP